MRITKLFPCGVSSVTPESQGIRALTLYLDHLLEGEVLLPVVWRRFGVPDGRPFLPLLLVLLRVALQKDLNVGVHLEAEVFQQLLAL